MNGCTHNAHLRAHTPSRFPSTLRERESMQKPTNDCLYNEVRVQTSFERNRIKLTAAYRQFDLGPSETPVTARKHNLITS